MIDDFTEFAVERTPHLYRAALLLCGDHHGAWDLTQEALTRVYVASRKRGIEEPAAYAQRVLINAYISRGRRRSSREIPVDNFGEAVYETPDPVVRLALVEALDGLGRIDRAVVVMRYYEDLSVDDTAKLLRLTPGAVRNRCMRALAKLRATMPLELKEQS